MAAALLGDSAPEHLLVLHGVHPRGPSRSLVRLQRSVRFQLPYPRPKNLCTSRIARRYCATQVRVVRSRQLAAVTARLTIDASPSRLRLASDDNLAICPLQYVLPNCPAADGVTRRPGATRGLICPNAYPRDAGDRGAASRPGGVPWSCRCRPLCGRGGRRAADRDVRGERDRHADRAPASHQLADPARSTRSSTRPTWCAQADPGLPATGPDPVRPRRDAADLPDRRLARRCSSSATR